MSSLQTFMEKVAPKFHELNQANGQLVTWEQECQFAKQQVSKNDYIMRVAQNNQASLANAIQNVAAIGISLNPASSYAYLVPREGMVCLDISYKGLIKLATDTGSILFAKADLVYKSDDFEYRGPCEKPTVKADVFSGDRGDIVGAYCVAKTAEGDYLTEIMTLKEIHAVRDKSKAFTSGKTCPWTEFEGEMMKKAVIKRASKTWPHTEKRERLDRAISIINEHEGLRGEQLAADEVEPVERACYSDDDFNANSPKWIAAIESKKMTAEQVIGKVEAKAPLTDEQKDILMSIVPVEEDAA